MSILLWLPPKLKTSVVPVSKKWTSALTQLLSLILFVLLAILRSQGVFEMSARNLHTRLEWLSEVYEGLLVGSCGMSWSASFSSVMASFWFRVQLVIRPQYCTADCCAILEANSNLLLWWFGRQLALLNEIETAVNVGWSINIFNFRGCRDKSTQLSQTRT